MKKQKKNKTPQRQSPEWKFLHPMIGRTHVRSPFVHFSSTSERGVVSFHFSTLPQERRMGKTEGWGDVWKDVVAGSARGAAQIAVGHPFDTLKVRLQVNSALDFSNGQAKKIAPSGPQFQGVRHCFKETVRCDGFFGLYRGASSPLAGCLVYSATLFAAWGQSQRFAQSLTSLSSSSSSSSSSSPDELSTSQLVVAGMMTGFAASFVESPVDLVKTTMQTHYNKKYFGTTSSGKKPENAFSCAKRMVQRKGGILNLYRGFNATLLRNIPGSVTYFTSYEVFCHLLSKTSLFSNSSSDKPKAMVVTAGGFAGIVFWITIFPFDVIKSHIQSYTPSSSSSAKSLKIGDVMRKIYAQRGWRGFFIGMSPALLRGFPTNGLSFLAFETCREWLG